MSENPPTASGFSPSQRAVIRDYFTVAREFYVVIERRLFAAAGVSVADHEMLVPLSQAERDGLRAGALAAAAGWPTSRVAHQVRRMEERGLVTRRADPDDARGTIVRLTDIGFDIAQQVQPTMEDTIRSVLIEALNDKQLTEFGTYCRTIVDRIELVKDEGGRC